MPRRPKPEPMRERPRLSPQPDGYAHYGSGPQEAGRDFASGNPGDPGFPANPGFPGNPESPGNPGESGPAPGGQLVGPVPLRQPPVHAQPRQRRRQRSIRSTVTMLLIIPLVTLLGLLTYSFVTTVPGFLADRNNTAVNNDVGGPLQGLLTQLDTEAALTYARDSFPRLIPAQQQAAQRKLEQQLRMMPPAQAQQAEATARAQAQELQQQSQAVAQQLKAQRPKTDAAIAAFRAGQSKLVTAGLLPAQDRPLAAALLQQLQNVSELRAQSDNHSASPLTVFKGYNGVIGAIFPYVAAMPNTRSTVTMFSQSMGTLFMGQALTDVAAEATLGNGAHENGGVVTGPVYEQFRQIVDSQRQLDQSGATMLNIANTNGTDPYVEALNSPQFKAFQSLEDTVVADGPNRKLPASPQEWQQESQAALAQLTRGETAERLTVTKNAAHASNVTEYELFGVGGLGLLLVLLSSLLLLRFGNRVSRELRSLRAAARGLAFQRLPGVVSRLRVGDDLDTEAEAPPLRLNTKTLEVTETADAFSAVQRTAVQAAIDQAVLRKAVNNVFRRLARRNQGLLQRQLKMLDEMERGTHDPDALGQLFRLDHLTTRMRRQAEGLIILSGAAPGRGWRQPVQVVEVLRGAVGEIEDYVRVDLATDSPDYLQGSGVADVTHLLAELIENAVAYSPPTTRVQVRGGRVANGYVVEVEDRGPGMPADALAALNQRLAEPPDFDVADSDQLGLFVVSRLAARHGIKVSMRPSIYGGITAIVLLPHSLVVSPEEAAYLASHEQGGPAGRRQTGPMEAIGNGRGRMAAAVGAAADALTGRRRRADSGPIPSGDGSGPMPALGGTPPLPSRADRPAGSPFPGAAGARPGSASGPFPAPPADGYQGAATSREGLPRRERMANIAPQLRDGGPVVPPGPVVAKSPEQARTLMSDIQRGLRTGRNANVNGNGTDGQPR